MLIKEALLCVKYLILIKFRRLLYICINRQADQKRKPGRPSKLMDPDKSRSNTKEITSMGSIVQETSMSTTKRTIQKIVYKFYMVLLYEIGVNMCGKILLINSIVNEKKYRDILKCDTFIRAVQN